MSEQTLNIPERKIAATEFRGDTTIDLQKARKDLQSFETARALGDAKRYASVEEGYVAQGLEQLEAHANMTHETLGTPTISDARLSTKLIANTYRSEYELAA